jgi:hypothetical protein
MLGKGYDPGVVRDVVRRLQRRRPDIESLAYFDAGLADRHSKRAETPAARAMAGAGVDWDAEIGVYAAVIFGLAAQAPRASSCWQSTAPTPPRMPRYENRDEPIATALGGDASGFASASDRAFPLGAG